MLNLLKKKKKNKKNYNLFASVEITNKLKSKYVGRCNKFGKFHKHFGAVL